MADKGNFGRRTWDRDEYAEKAKLRYESYKNGSNKVNSNVKEISRDSLNFNKDLGKKQVITGNISGTRGKGFGFHCEVCDLTFKDNLKYVQHLNSSQHLANSGQKRQVVEVSLEEVKERYEWLVKQLEEKEEKLRSSKEFSLVDDIARRKELYEQEKEEKKLKEREKRENKRKLEEEENDTGDDDMKRLMGIGGFGSTKK